MDKDQTREAEMAFSEALRQKAREGRPRLEDLWSSEAGEQEPEPRSNETGSEAGEDES